MLYVMWVTTLVFPGLSSSSATSLFFGDRLFHCRFLSFYLLVAGFYSMIGIVPNCSSSLFFYIICFLLSPFTSYTSFM